MVVNAYDYQWLDFEGQAANALEDYFSSFNNVLTCYQITRSEPLCSNLPLGEDYCLSVRMIENGTAI
jgi:hypothetical protein